VEKKHQPWRESRSRGINSSVLIIKWPAENFGGTWHGEGKFICPAVFAIIGVHQMTKSLFTYFSCFIHAFEWALGGSKHKVVLVLK
jgi:hypothetical protein